MDHFTATHMETTPLLIPADPFEAIINGELVQSAELQKACWLKQAFYGKTRNTIC